MSPKKVHVGPFRTDGCSEQKLIIPARFFDCPAYEDCLEIACRYAWRSFECIGCSFAPKDLEPTELGPMPEDDLWTPLPPELPKVNMKRLLSN